MTQAPRDSDVDPLLRDAIAWVVRLRSGEATQADLAAIREWRLQSDDHEEAFRQAARLWRDLKTAADGIVEHRQREHSALSSLHPTRWSPTRRIFIGGAIAASAAAYMISDPPMQLWPSLNELAADYRTGKGERREVALAQGVSVTLNTLTSITLLRADDGDPQFELIAGEAAITVKRSMSRPLVVQALGSRLVANGASFNARCLDRQLSVTCLEGQLDVERERDLVQLRAGQQIASAPNSGISVATAVDLADVIAWQHNLLIVRDRPLVEVVDEVNRYRPGRIVVTNTSLGRRLVNGTFHLKRLEDFPSQVRELFGAGIRSLPGGIVLLS